MITQMKKYTFLVFHREYEAFLEQLREAGVPSAVAAGIVRWRSYGKVYRIKEDLTQVSGMNDSIYALLKPYISIADSLARRTADSLKMLNSNQPQPEQADDEFFY